MVGGADTVPVLEAAFVKASVHRSSVVATLRDWPKTTGQVALACGLNVPHASRAIRELIDRGLLVSQTPDRGGRGRLYGLTEAGSVLAGSLEREGKGLQMAPMVRVTQPQAWYHALSRRFGREKARETLSAVGLADAIDQPKRQWVPLHAQLKLLEEIERQYGDSSYLLVRELAADAVAHYATVRRLAMRALPLRLLLDLAPTVYLREFNHGRMEVDLSAGHAKFKHYEWMSSPASCASWLGSYEGAFALLRVEARVRKEECILRGDEFCGYAAEWQE